MRLGSLRVRWRTARPRWMRIRAQKVERKVERALEVGRLAVQRASKLCREVQWRLKQTEEMGKADASPVTVADFGAQAVVAYTLQDSLRDVKVSLVAEEDASAISGPEFKEMRGRITELVNAFVSDNGVTLSEADVMDLINLGRSEGGSSGMCWVLDPIDGTIGFVSNRQYAVCLGLLSDGEAIMGLLGCPNMPRRKIVQTDGEPVTSSELHAHENNVGCLFTGIKHQGAYVGALWSSDSATEQISVDTETPLHEIRFMESFESRHSNRETAHNLVPINQSILPLNPIVVKAVKLGIQQTPLRLDSQAKYGRFHPKLFASIQHLGALSRGDAGLFMRFPPSHYREKIWDHCAGAVIVEAAGGKISDAAGDKLDFSQGRFLDIHKGIIAAPPALHSKVLSLF